MNIPDAAITAAAETLAILYGHAERGPVEAALAAALPHLGEVDTTYATRVHYPGGTIVHDDYATPDLASARERAARLNWGPNATITVVQRTVTVTEWTEVET